MQYADLSSDFRSAFKCKMYRLAFAEYLDFYYKVTIDFVNNAKKQTEMMQTLSSKFHTIIR